MDERKSDTASQEGGATASTSEERAGEDSQFKKQTGQGDRSKLKGDSEQGKSGQDEKSDKQSGHDGDSSGSDRSDDSDNSKSDQSSADNKKRRESFAEWRKKPRNKLILVALAMLIVGAVIWAVLWWLESRKWQTTANAYIQAPIARLSPGVPGHVARVLVRDNQRARR